MKRLSALSLLIVIFATSCQTGSELGSTSLIQKRRYTKGFNLNVNKPVLAKGDAEQNSTSEIAQVEAMTPKKTEQLNTPNYELKSEKNIELDIASQELSQSLLEVPTEAVKAQKGGTTAPLTDVADAYPLTMKNQRTGYDGDSGTVAANGGAEVTILIIILTILLPPLGVALVYGISMEFWISLVLTLLFYFPGLIYSLIIIL